MKPTTKKPRTKKPKLAASHTPHDCVVLAVDPGKVSGYALFCRGELQDSYEVTSADVREYCVNHAVNLSDNERLPLVVVAEKWTAGGWRSAASMIGLGAAWGAWAEQLERYGVPKRRIMRVYSQTWRAAVIGGAQRSSAAWKTAAMQRARPVFKGVHGTSTFVGPDEAEAICIGLWAIKAGEVAAALPKAKKKRAA